MHLYAAISMTDEDVVRRFAEIVGFGNVQYQPRKQRPHHTPTWRWAVNGEAVERLYALLEPWLGERRKARYAELLRERREYEAERRHENQRRGTRVAQASRDPRSGRFVTQGRLP